MVKTLRGETLRKRICQDCPDAIFHETGSMIWLSCKFQSGWRAVDSICNLDGQKLDKITGLEVKK